MIQLMGLEGVEIVTAVEETFGIVISDKEADDADFVKDLGMG